MFVVFSRIHQDNYEDRAGNDRVEKKGNGDEVEYAEPYAILSNIAYNSVHIPSRTTESQLNLPTASNTAVYMEVISN